MKFPKEQKSFKKIIVRTGSLFSGSGLTITGLTITQDFNYL